MSATKADSLKSKYAAKYRHPKWQKKRLEVMERDGFKCFKCESEDNTLNVHHAYYVTGRDIWDYPMHSLKTLCEDCHKSEHEKKDYADDEIQSRQTELEIAIGWLSGDVPDPDIWDMAIMSCQLIKAGMDRDDLYHSIAEHLHGKLSEMGAIK